MRRIGILGLLLAARISAQQPPAQSPSSPYAVLVGAVIDSIRGGPLTGAIVVISGTDRQATVDSTGRFRIDSIPPGDHELGVFHPLLDSLNISISSKSVPLPAGLVSSIVMATPSAATTVAVYCSEAERQRGPAAVIGRVLAADSDHPIKDATVRYTSVSIEVGKTIGLRRNTFSREENVKATGEFALCGLPATGGGIVHATRGQIVTGEIVADVSRRLLAIVTLRLDTLKRGTAVVIGRIVDDKGTPIPKADVTLAGSRIKTVTGDGGSFALRDLPAGSQTIQVRKVGFVAVDTALTLSSVSPLQLAMNLHATAVTLNTVNVHAARLAALQRVGFERRRKTGIGQYLTEDEIRSRGKGRLSDVARTIPGLQVRYTSSGLPVIVQGRGASNTLTGCVTYLLDANPYLDRPPGTIDALVRSEDVIGLEVYGPSEVPADLVVTQAGMSSCTLVVIWTRATSRN
jgi:hypothetical protein